MAGYGTDPGFTAWLSAQGLDLPEGAPLPAVLRQIGSDYVDGAYEAALQCSHRTGGFEQERAWPRTGHRVNGQAVPDDLIPLAWVNASYRAAYLEAVTPGWSGGGTNPGRLTKREKVDVIEREFFSPADTAIDSRIAPGMPFDAVINSLVLAWLCSATRRADSLLRVI